MTESRERAALILSSLRNIFLVKRAKAVLGPNINEATIAEFVRLQWSTTIMYDRIIRLVNGDSVEPLQSNWYFVKLLFMQLVYDLPQVTRGFAEVNGRAYYSIHNSVYDPAVEPYDPTITTSPDPVACSAFLAYVQAYATQFRPEYLQLREYEQEDIPDSPRLFSFMYRAWPLPSPEDLGQEPFRLPLGVIMYGLSNDNQAPETDEEHQALVDRAMFVWRDMLEGDDVELAEEQPHLP